MLIDRKTIAEKFSVTQRTLRAPKHAHLRGSSGPVGDW